MAATMPRHVMAKTQHKEVWLANALDKFIRNHFSEQGYTVPEHVRVSTGFPSRGALSNRKRRIGEAWSNKCSSDGTHEIIISVTIDDPVQVLGVLIHEVIHVTVGVQHGHKKPFTTCMKAVGLTGKATATTESDELKATLAKWIDKLGPYPHAKLSGLQREKQSTRLIKMGCDDCGCIIRTTAKWLDEHGDTWPCPCGGYLMA